MQQTLDIGSNKQLFIDDGCIEETVGVHRNLHQATRHPANPLLTQEEWWEGYFATIYGNVIHDAESGEFRMWYNAAATPNFRAEPGGTSVCHATSNDGIHWERSQLDLFELNGRPLSNAVLQGHYRLPTVFHTPEDPDPQRRYKMIAYLMPDTIDFQNELKTNVRNGYGVLFSPDGIHWTEHVQNPVIQGSDMCTCFYDPAKKEYVALVKFLTTIGGKFRRVVGVSTSRDFLNWGVVQSIVSADEIDDARVADRLYRFRNIVAYNDPKQYTADIYGMTGFSYEGRLMGLIWLYDRSGDRPPEHGSNDDGVINTQLVYATSDNAYAYWERVGDRRDFLSCGAEGSYDAGMTFPASTVIEVGDEIWFYYTGVDGSHCFHERTPGRPRPQTKFPLKGTSINLATLRRDGFVSLYASYPGGHFTSRLLTFTGSELEINADSEHGSITVELLGENGAAVPGYSQAECIPFRADAIRGRVEWENGRDLSSLQGRPIRLKFHLQTAKLFAFKFV